MTALCIDRIGVARLTAMAFNGVDLHPLWHELMEKADETLASTGMGMDLSIIAQLLGNKETGLAIQKEMLAQQRLYRTSCATRTPDLRVLALAAQMDIGGNTPIEFLLEGSNIELTTLYVVPGLPIPQPLPPHDIAVVVVPDDKETRATLAEIERLIAHWPVPVLNLPQAIGRLDRDRLFHLLQGVSGLEIPQTAKVSRETLAAHGEGRDIAVALPGATFPVIVRPIGSHAGFGLDKLDAPADIGRYLGARAETEFFVSPYVDYSDADGQFRKYRIVCIDGRSYPVHMAISDQWKIWYLNADMALSGIKRAQEAGWMANYDDSFAVRHARALGELARRIGLDYVTVDCAETKNGELLIFEADNAAIVHNMDPPSIFPYKPAQMLKIYDAFAAMLYNRAGKIGARAA